MPSADGIEALPGGSLTSAPASPYTSTWLQICNLTLPPVPNFEIPPSPPGSPPLAATAKIARFLELKRQGVHFNERLQQSSALRNPGLLQKLRDFAGISEEEQYACALPAELATPTTYPEWAYADQMIKAHEKMSKDRVGEMRGKRDKLDFVPAKAESPASSGTLNAGGRRSRFEDQDARNRWRSRSPRR